MKEVVNGNISGKKALWSNLTDTELAAIADKVPVHSPEIRDGVLWIWDDKTKKYIDSGVKAQGEGAESDVFIVQFDSSKKTADKTYAEILEATQQHKVVMLYDQNKANRLLATLGTVEKNDNALVFVSHNILNMTEITEYVCYTNNVWLYESNKFMHADDISAENPDFVNAVVASLPDADSKSFPLENAVSEVMEE